MLIINNNLFLNLLLGYISYNKLRFIILKLKIELIEIIIKSIVNKIPRIEIKPKILNIKYKKPIYKEV